MQQSKNKTVVMFLRICITYPLMFSENGSIMRTCAPIAIEDCKKANGINYCYCKKEGCNTPERRLSDPERTGKHIQAGGPEKKFLDHSKSSISIFSPGQMHPLTTHLSAVSNLILVRRTRGYNILPTYY